MTDNNYPTLDKLDAAGKVVLVRADLDLPLTPRGEVASDLRLQGLLPTLNELRDAGARIVLCGHAGRPRGRFVSSMSLRPVAERLSELAGCDVQFMLEPVGKTVDAAIANLRPGEVMMLENMRFHPGEEQNDTGFASLLGRSVQAFVSDAFSTSHRRHASLCAITDYVDEVYLGRKFVEELESFGHVLSEPERPLTVISGGTKIGTKVDVIRNLLPKTDQLIFGGAMANTFLATLGYRMGSSLFEPAMMDLARDILREAGVCGCRVLLPSDVVVARRLATDEPAEVVPVSEVPSDCMVLDVGPETMATWQQRIIPNAKTVLWNGPLGAFEYPPFDTASSDLARTLADSDAYTLVGGGDTLNAVQNAGVALDRFGATSTAGGALLEYLAGRPLPALDAVLTAARRAA